jgi:esterase/lipase superfamily enzyme
VSPDRHLLLPSRHLGRDVHLWTHGWYGAPVLVFPTASGMAPEWQLGGAIEALRPLLAAGRIKLYCPESNASETFLARTGTPAERVARHERYERFVVDELVPWIRQDCRTPDLPIATVGASLGALYAARMTLARPETFRWSLCLSGRYSAAGFLPELDADPMGLVATMSEERTEHVRRSTRLVLVVGQGPHEGACLPETLRLSDLLTARAVPHERDVWGRDVAHAWPWWRRQLVHHMTRRFGAPGDAWSQPASH